MCWGSIRTEMYGIKGMQNSWFIGILARLTPLPWVGYTPIITAIPLLLVSLGPIWMFLTIFMKSLWGFIRNMKTSFWAVFSLFGWTSDPPYGGVTGVQKFFFVISCVFGSKCIVWACPRRKIDLSPPPTLSSAKLFSCVDILVTLGQTVKQCTYLF